MLTLLGPTLGRPGTGSVSLSTCQVVTQQSYCRPPPSPPPPSPPPPSPPPPSPPPPAMPWFLTESCVQFPCPLDDVFARLSSDAPAGEPLVLHLGAGVHTLSSIVLLDASIAASAIHLVGSTDAVLAPQGHSIVLSVAAGAPPVLLQALTLRGQVRVAGDSRVRVQECVFDGHASASAGAALHVDGGSVDVHGTRFSNLLSQADGGALAVLGGQLSLVNCTFVSNRARRGGAAHASGGILHVRHTLFESNQASEDGGALAIDGNAAVMISALSHTPDYPTLAAKPSRAPTHIHMHRCCLPMARGSAQTALHLEARSRCSRGTHRWPLDCPPRWARGSHQGYCAPALSRPCHSRATGHESPIC